MNPARRSYILFSVLLLTVQVTAQTPLKSRDTTVKGPQTFAMIVGISKYKYVRPLTYADKDATLFRNYLLSPGGGNVKADNIFTLLNEQAINSSFWGKGFQWLKAKNLQRGDKLFIYLAGHGDAIDEDQFFFLGYDCNPRGDKNNYLVSGAIQLFNLKKKIANETAKGVEVVFIMDACRSNELPGGTAGQSFLNTAISEKQAGEIIMLATGAGQVSLEDASIGTGQGLFTYYLVDGLNGLADSLDIPDQKVSFREIQSYVSKYVPSIAQQRFNRKQDPFFCCTENSERIISTVDTNYLRNWLRTKRTRGPGNSFGTDAGISFYQSNADTLLLQTYDRFYNAVRRNNLTGQSSAEDYYRQLQTKYPGNPYTLDAQSTLAVELVNVAQRLVDDYLGCVEPSPRQKQEMSEAANGLEKAISILREYDPDFANSLRGRLYLLKASSNNAPGISLQYAHTGLSIEPGGAYILNKLALLHLENNRPDSALFFAQRATAIAPNWACALTTLALVQKALSNNKPGEEKKKPVKSKSSFGFALGGGAIESKPTYLNNPNTGVVSVDSKGAAVLDIGIIYNIVAGTRVAVRPAITFVYGNSEVIFFRRNLTGGEIFRELVPVVNTSVNVSLPVVIRFSDKKISPFISLGPSFNYKFGERSAVLPVKKSVVLGDAGIGADLRIIKTGLIISPELKYSLGLTDMKDDASSTIYSSSISSLKQRSIMLTIYLRR